MSLIKKFIKKNLIDIEVKNSIILGRGNIKDLFPSDCTDIEKENIATVRKYTMTSIERQVSLSRAVDYLIENNIPGDIVECGVWKGGSMMLIARKLLQLKNSDRKLFLFDTFEGMSEPDEKDVSSETTQQQKNFSAKENRLEGIMYGVIPL